MNSLTALFERFDIWAEILSTLMMSVVPVIIAYIIGLPIGVLCVTSDKNGIKPNKYVNSVCNLIINLGRSIPFIILMFLIIEFTRLIVGTSIGPVAALVPLTVTSIPFVARMVEQSLKEVDEGVVEAAICMGATDFQIITKVLLVETVPSLIRGFSITIITLIGYTAMAGAVGARGLGYLAINQGFNRNNMELMYLCLILLIAMIQIFQVVLEFVAKKVDKKKLNSKA